MSTHQASLFDPTEAKAAHPAYVIQGSERPDDLPRLKQSAATMEARVLQYFWARSFSGDPHDGVRTPSECASALNLDLTTVRPRICQLSKPDGRLERCTWLPRVRTKAGGSEAKYRLRRQ